MNHIAIIERAGNPRFDIAVDGRCLADHFVGRRGAHPSQVAPIGWKNAPAGIEREAVEQLLGLRRSGLVSARVPVLVCEECGDLACGAIAVRIERHGTLVTWTDWAYENGYEPAQELSWPTIPEPFQFELAAYERAFADVVPEATNSAVAD